MAQRLNLSQLAGAERELEFGGVVYPIPGRLPVPTLLLLLDLEERYNNAAAGRSDEDVIAVLKAAYTEVMRIIRGRTPDVPDLDLDDEQLLAAMAFIAGDDSVAQAFAAATVPPARDRDDEEQPRARTAEEVTAEGDLPLASAT